MSNSMEQYIKTLTQVNELITIVMDKCEQGYGSGGIHMAAQVAYTSIEDVCQRMVSDTTITE